MRFRIKIILLKKKLVVGKTLNPSPWTTPIGLSLWTGFSLILLLKVPTIIVYSKGSPQRQSSGIVHGLGVRLSGFHYFQETITLQRKKLTECSEQNDKFTRQMQSVEQEKPLIFLGYFLYQRLLNLWQIGQNPEITKKSPVCDIHSLWLKDASRNDKYLQFFVLYC